MKNYRERLESLIKDLNVLCLEHNNNKENPGEFKLVNVKFANWENKFLETVQETRIAMFKMHHDMPVEREQLNLKETIRLMIIYEEDCSDSLDGKNTHIVIQKQIEYFQNDRERVEDYMYRGLYYEFLKYTLFSQEAEYEDLWGCKIKIIPVRDLIVYGLKK